MVIDTNVLVSAFVFPGGAPEAVWLAALAGRLQPVTSAGLLAELSRVLAEKFGWDTPSLDRAVRLIVRHAAVVDPAGTGESYFRDRDDDHLMLVALAAGADAIVTGDRDVLDIGASHGIAFIRPDELLRLLP